MRWTPDLEIAIGVTKPTIRFQSTMISPERPLEGIATQPQLLENLSQKQWAGEELDFISIKQMKSGFKLVMTPDNWQAKTCQLALGLIAIAFKLILLTKIEEIKELVSAHKTNIQE